MTLNDTKIDKYVIIASSKGEPMGKPLNRKPGLRFLISSLLVISQSKEEGKPHDLTSTFRAVPGMH